MNDNFSNQNPEGQSSGNQDAADADLIPALTAMLERRADSAQSQPNLDAVRAEALHGSSVESGSVQAGGARRRPYQIALAAAALLIVGGGIIAISSRSNVTEVGPADAPTVDTAVGTTDDTTVDEQATTETTTPSVEETTSVPTNQTDSSVDTSVASVDSSPVNEAEQGLRFDFGDIVRVEEVDGVEWIWFDRSGFGEEQLQGLELTSEPRYELATDWHGGQNLNPRLRSYPLAPNAEVIQIDPQIIEQACGPDGVSGPVFIDSDVATMLAANANLVSLTFDGQRRVTLVRDQMGC